MKVLKLLFLLFISVILLNSCDVSGSGEGDIPDFIPEIAFGDISLSRAIIDLSDSATGQQAAYLSLSPLLNNFKRNSSITGGENYSVPVFGSNMVFDIEPQSGGSTFLFSGKMDDDSGWLNVTYNQSTKTFSFEQCLLIEDPNNGPTSYIIYASGSDIQMDTDGYFHDWYDIAYISKVGDGWEFCSGSSEIFRGIMNNSNEVGTGFAYFADADTDNTDGVRFYTLEDKPAGSPDTISKANLSLWYDILSSNSTKSLDDSNDFAEGFWEIRYHLDGSSDYIRISDDTEDEGVEDNNLTGFKLGFQDTFTGPDLPSRADLTSWGNSSLIVDVLE